MAAGALAKGAAAAAGLGAAAETAAALGAVAETAAEAKALIPSLENMEGRKLDNAQLTELLQQLAANKQFST